MIKARKAHEKGFVTAAAVPVLMSVMLVLTVFCLQVSSLLDWLDRTIRQEMQMRRLEFLVLRIMEELEEAAPGSEEEFEKRLSEAAQELEAQNFYLKTEKAFSEPGKFCSCYLRINHGSAETSVSGVLTLQLGNSADGTASFRYKPGVGEHAFR